MRMTSGKPNQGFYENGTEHLNDGMQKLNALIQVRLREMGTRYSADRPDMFDGLHISAEEIQRLLVEDEETNRQEGKSAAEYRAYLAKVEEMEANSLERGIYMPLIQLAVKFHLTPFEKDVVLLCMAPELDRKYEKIYGYLQDDMLRKQPTVGLILDLLCNTFEERTAALACFHPHGSLSWYGLITTIDEGDIENNTRESLLSRSLKLDDRIVAFLLEHNGMDARLDPYVKLIYPRRDWESLVMEEDRKMRLVRLAEERFENNGHQNPPLIMYLRGTRGAGKRTVAEAFCSHLEIPMMIVDTGRLCEQLQAAGNGAKNVLTRVLRETLLLPAAIYFNEYDNLFEATGGDNVRENHQTRYRQETIIEGLKEYAFLAFLAGEKPWRSPGALDGRSFVKIDIPVPSYPMRKRLWEQTLDGRINGKTGIDIEAVAGTFNINGGRIRAAVEEAVGHVRMRKGKEEHNENNEEITLTTDDLYHGCRTQTNQKLMDMAQKIEPNYTWDDIVLPADKIRQLKEICSHVKYRYKVYINWGYAAKFSLGKGLNILFSGPSGTGKTMSAEIIAGELGLALYKIDLSNVVSKYIGETEKNLKRIFDEAETANSILFFDEADALFGKRTEVKDSHDRYANIEINYLLQKMEEQEGIVILATNFLKNIDDAFKRRINFSIDFPFPDEQYRLKIWRNIFPSEVPGTKTLDLGFLAKKFKLSGGNIKNISVNAAFLAAERSHEMEMRYAVQATRRELQKMGKVCTPSDFGKYYHHIAAEEER